MKKCFEGGFSIRYFITGRRSNKKVDCHGLRQFKSS